MKQSEKLYYDLTYLSNEMHQDNINGLISYIENPAEYEKLNGFKPTKSFIIDSLRDMAEFYNRTFKTLAIIRDLNFDKSKINLQYSVKLHQLEAELKAEKNKNLFLQ